MMRRILVDAARTRGREKRGGSAQRIDLDQIPDISARRDPELIAIDEALETLAGLDPRKAQVIELRFFGGPSVAETAEVSKVHEQTVLRDWRLARVWLLREISGRRLGSSGPNVAKMRLDLHPTFTLLRSQFQTPCTPSMNPSRQQRPAKSRWGKLHLDT